MKHVPLTFPAPRLIVLAATALALTFLVSGSPPSASAGSGYTLSIDSAVVPPGGAAAVELNLVAPDPGLGSYAIDIAYDDSVADIASCQSLLGSCNKVYGEDLIRVVGVPFAPMIGEKMLATLVFETTGGGKTTLDVRATMFYGPNGEDLARSVDIHDGTLEAQGNGTDIQLGDATCDGRVDSLDALQILTEKANPTGDPCLPYGDVNCDDIVNAKDVIVLLRDVANVSAPDAC
jgi:hypothetical protein